MSYMKDQVDTKNHSSEGKIWCTHVIHEEPRRDQETIVQKERSDVHMSYMKDQVDQMYDMCISDLSFCTIVSSSLPGPLCMICVHQIFPSELWFLGLYLVLHVWHVYIRSSLLNYGFLVSTWSFMYDMCTSDLSFWTMVSWSLPGPSCMTCVHQILPSVLWFLGLYLVLHVLYV